MDATAKTPKLRLKLKPLRGGRCVAWEGVSWRDYSALLRIKGDRTNPKMVYLDRRLWLMSPLFFHDILKVRSGRFVDEVATGLGIRCVPAGSTTFRLGKKRGGFEPDQSHYLVNAPRLRNRTEIDLNLDPPPDLVIEIVYTHAAKKTIATCRRLGVPEMWICDETQLRFLVLQSNGRYAESATSAAFPFLTAEEIDDWVRKPAKDDDETKWALELRRWVADVLVHRVRGVQQP